jgi:hypothetical protein
LTLGIFLPSAAWAQGEPSGAAPPPEPPPDTAQPPPPGPPPSSAEPQPGPGGQYYQEPPYGGGEPPPPGYYEPPPPGYRPVWEPPPPPKPRHRAPKTAFWLGPRVGYFVPFGNLWLQEKVDSSNRYYYDEVKWSEYASAGPMFELDVGARFGRHYNVFALWERASLGTGSAAPDAYGGQKSGSTDYYAIGLRVSSDADKVGFLTEIDLGYRRFRAVWEDGTELQLTDSPLEFRIGLGADIRLTPMFSLSPMITLGAGAFGTAELVQPDGTKVDATQPGDQSAGHGWLTFQLGGHFDIPGGDG